MNRVARALVVLSALLILTLTAKNAYAGPVTGFELQWSSKLYGSGSGLFTATDEGGGQFLLTGIVPGTGTQAGIAIKLLGAGGYFGNDNLLFPGQPGFFDNNGFSFASATADFNIYLNGSAISEISNALNISAPVSFTVTPVSLSEPSSIIVLSSGLLVFVGVVRKRLL